MSANRPAWLRWLVPAVAILATTAGAAALKTAASAEPRLPARTAAQLLVDLQTARVDGLSGMVTQRADLGLPALPGLGGQGAPDLSSLITGTHTLRVWYSGPNSARVALLGTLGESDVITNGSDVWIWSSRDNTATHRVLPKDTEKAPPLDPAHLPKTPQEAADAALAAIDPTTAVTTAGPVKVAGRASYELVLAPRDKASLISQVRIAIDGDKHVPLRVRVFAQGIADPAIEVAFTQVSFARPGAEHFRFNPPPGAKVVDEKSAPAPSQKDSAKKDPGKNDSGKSPADKPKMAVIGQGWTTVLVARVPLPGTGAAKPSASSDQGSSELNGLLRRLPAVQGAWGTGHLLSGTLFSVLLTADGRTLIGAVRPDRLYQAAADPAAALK
jgi:outer membrane lipoprotein-sorting protein